MRRSKALNIENELTHTLAQVMIAQERRPAGGGVGGGGDDDDDDDEADVRCSRQIRDFRLRVEQR